MRHSRWFGRMLTTILTVATSAGAAAPPAPRPELQVWALEITVSDLDANCRFYDKAFGFKVEERHEDYAVLTLDGARLVLSHGDDPPRGLKPGVYLNMQVKDLAIAADRARAAGARIDDPTVIPFVLGKEIVIHDPAGNTVQLLQIDGASMEDDKSCTVFNVGFIYSDLNQAEEFFTGLGFEVYSRRWLPATLPLNERGSFALVLHKRENAQARRRSSALVLVSTRPNVVQTARRSDSVHATKLTAPIVAGRRAIAVEDPSGNPIKVIEGEIRLVAKEPNP